MSAPILSDDPQDLMELREKCLYAAIAGKNSPGGIAKYLHLDQVQGAVNQIESLIRTASFQEDVKKGRADQIASVLERFRNSLHRYADEAESIALTGEERNRVTMLKDLMDRAGTGAALKMAVSTPSEYRRLMADLLAEPVKPENK